MIARATRSLQLRAADAADRFRGRSDRLIPPRRLTGYVGGGDFRSTGEEFAGHFRSLAGLRPEDRVLDVGCGIGRMARPLVAILRPPGSYDGFDIVLAGIRWCGGRYHDTPAPFRFQHADVRNTTYNPGGSSSATEYRFPYPDGCFDLVFATSVFTHLMPDAATHYLSEVVRVLAPEGRLLTTWLLFGEPTRPPPPLRVLDSTWPAAVSDPANPELATAYPEGWLREQLLAHGLELRSLHPGRWNGGAGLSWQDIAVAGRSRAVHAE